MPSERTTVPRSRVLRVEIARAISRLRHDAEHGDIAALMFTAIHTDRTTISRTFIAEGDDTVVLLTNTARDTCREGVQRYMKTREARGRG